MTRQERLAEVYAAYQRLEVLASLAAQYPFVPGEGPLNSPMMLIGEAPGEQESKQGRPFVGPAGRQLNRLLADAALERRILRVTNVLHYQMPGNRAPEQYEIAASRRCLMEELDIVRPKVIVTLGGPALRALGRIVFPRLTDCHGQLISWPHPYGWNVAVYPLFHPSYTLRNPEAEQQVQKALSMLSGAAHATG
jgi:uracil-DNA glycosylase family 4